MAIKRSPTKNRCRRGIKNSNSIKGFLDINCGMQKEYIIKELCKRFNLSKEDASSTYDKWKKDFLSSNYVINNK